MAGYSLLHGYQNMSAENVIGSITTYSKDTPVGRPSIDGRAGVFVPTEYFEAGANSIRKGAGIVGFGNPDGSLMIYFEGNRFDESALHKWENKARKAYDRMVMAAPTVSKVKIDAKMMEYIGYIDGTGITLRVPEKLADWLRAADAMDTAPENTVITWGKR